MAIYSKGMSLLSLSANAPSMELIGFSDEHSAILTLKIFLETAPGGTSTFGLGMASVKGTGPVPVVSCVEDIVAPVDVFPTVALSWTGAAPAVPAQFFRMGDLDSVVGDGIMWEFPRGLIVPPTSSIVLWNLTAIGNADVTLVYGD